MNFYQMLDDRMVRWLIIIWTALTAAEMIWIKAKLFWHLRRSALL